MVQIAYRAQPVVIKWWLFGQIWTKPENSVTCGYALRGSPLCIEIPYTVPLFFRNQYFRTLLHVVAGSIRGHTMASLFSKNHAVSRYHRIFGRQSSKNSVISWGRGIFGVDELSENPATFGLMWNWTKIQQYRRFDDCNDQARAGPFAHCKHHTILTIQLQQTTMHYKMTIVLSFSPSQKPHQSL